MMTIKEQEFKALEQIEKIIAGLGEDSYIGTAFEGCFEIARENIENDFADSMKQRAERARQRMNESIAKATDLGAKIDRLQQDRKRDALHIAEMEGRIKEQDAEIEKANAQVADFRKRAEENGMQVYRMKQELDIRDAEIVRLKAKLYDLLVKD